MSTFAEDVAKELAKARSRYPRINSAHEGYAVIAEELDEFWEEVRMKPASRSSVRMRAELVQVAAMAQRVAEDVPADCELFPPICVASQAHGG